MLGLARAVIDVLIWSRAAQTCSLPAGYDADADAAGADEATGATAEDDAEDVDGVELFVPLDELHPATTSATEAVTMTNPKRTLARRTCCASPAFSAPARG